MCVRLDTSQRIFVPDFFFLSPHPLVVVSRGGFHFFFFLFLLTFIILIIMIPLNVYVCSKKGRKFHLRGKDRVEDLRRHPSIHRGGEMMVGGRDDYVAFFFFFFYSFFFLFLRLEYLILPLVDKIFFSF